MELQNNTRIITMSEHKSWGNQIFFSNYEERRLSGWMSNLPKEGDILRCEMQSGKIARFKFEKVEQCKDPKDMFFATVSDLDYE